jgi:ketosteroid isomerase-like protein
MGPTGGFQVGWSQVQASWEAQAAMKLGGHVDATEVKINAGEDLAVMHNYEKGENKGADGKPETVLIRATSIFRKEKGEWKMIGHHTDLLPYLAK